MQSTRKWFGSRALMCGFGLLLLGLPVCAQNDTASSGSGQDDQALKMLRRGEALLEDRQEERGVEVVRGVLLNFPKSPVRLKAALLLGEYYAEKGDFGLATKNLLPVADAEDADPDQKAEALYRIGICQYGESDYNRALSTLRRVTEEYPWSVYANESYYYIGLCHFRLERWWKAVEALKLVGTSVPPNARTQNLVEGGQRFLVKIHDKDLRVLKVLDETFGVQVSTESGDTETLEMSVFDNDGEYFLADLRMELGGPVAGDGTLQIRGGDVVRVEYVDQNTQDGSPKVTRLAASRVVSTAVAGFVDGAYRTYVKGAFADQKTFLRVKDFDADTGDGRDKVTVKITSQFKVPEEEAEEGGVGEDAAPEYRVRDSLDVVLEETDAHTGFFTGTVVIEEGKDEAAVDALDSRIVAFGEDTIVLDYADKEHIGGLDDPRQVIAKAQFVVGQIPDVWIAHREVSKEELRARKNLIESRFYLRLAQIFSDVGLSDRAESKADIGLEKVDDILRRSLRASLDRDTVEQGYKVKWELLLAKGDLGGAIGACRTLMAMYPASSLADVALMQIARAHLEVENIVEALQILRGVLGIQANEELKAEAQYLIAGILEDRVDKNVPKDRRVKAMGSVIAAYKECADKFPNSPFAGEALSKVIDFHLASKDYGRCQELLQMVFVDYPDAPFLDEMLLKWGVVLYRMKQYGSSAEKLQQLMRDYPNSPAAGKGQKILEVVKSRA